MFLLLVPGTSIPSLILFPYTVFFAATVTVLISLFQNRLLDLIVGHRQPTLSLEPLQILSFGPGANLERSQSVNMAWASLPGSQNQLNALFGVIRVRALGDDAIACRAAGRVKLQSLWVDIGHLNWYSPTQIRNLTTIPNFQVPSLNTYLTNTSEHIPKDETKDLLIFYMVQNSSGVFVCSDMAHAIAGNAVSNQPSKFQLELSFTAEHLRRIVTEFDIEGTWGRFLIAKTT